MENEQSSSQSNQGTSAVWQIVGRLITAAIVLAITALTLVKKFDTIITKKLHKRKKFVMEVLRYGNTKKFLSKWIYS